MTLGEGHSMNLQLMIEGYPYNHYVSPYTKVSRLPCVALPLAI